MNRHVKQLDLTGDVALQPMYLCADDAAFQEFACPLYRKKQKNCAPRAPQWFIMLITCVLRGAMLAKNPAPSVPPLRPPKNRPIGAVFKVNGTQRHEDTKIYQAERLLRHKANSGVNFVSLGVMTRGCAILFEPS